MPALTLFLLLGNLFQLPSATLCDGLPADDSTQGRYGKRLMEATTYGRLIEKIKAKCLINIVQASDDGVMKIMAIKLYRHPNALSLAPTRRYVNYFCHFLLLSKKKTFKWQFEIQISCFATWKKNISIAVQHRVSF